MHTRPTHKLVHQQTEKGNLQCCCVAASLSGGCPTYMNTMNDTCYFCLLLLLTVQAIFPFSSIWLIINRTFQPYNHNLCMSSSLLLLPELKDSIEDYTRKTVKCLLPLLLSNMMCFSLCIPHSVFKLSSLIQYVCFKVP